ncbi:unnamed protein product [Nyctereutes procyonoides]|uniref:(raccoon dog) hypothetical protein n=1 Tax=Nyctereutes procyonoides TaxID=34880 RepID=A0A811Y737_NYCPR|nr:unnamed protein product [Nyctereutes procyonoides]
MGSAKSTPVTAAWPLLHNKLLAHVESSPQPNVPAKEQLKGPNPIQDSDPHSSTLGIAWTPMKTSSGDEAFETKGPKLNLLPEPVLPLEFSLDNQMPPWSQTKLPSKQVFSKEHAGQPSETPITSQGLDKPSEDPETPQSSDSKHEDASDFPDHDPRVLGSSPTSEPASPSPSAATLNSCSLFLKQTKLPSIY